MYIAGVYVYMIPTLNVHPKSLVLILNVSKLFLENTLPFVKQSKSVVVECVLVWFA